MSNLPYGTNLIRLDRKVIGCWDKNEKPLDAPAISKALKWLQGTEERPEVIFRPTDDTTIIFNAKGNEKDYYFVNPSVIFNGSLCFIVTLQFKDIFLCSPFMLF